MKISVLGIGLGKNVFHLFSVYERGQAMYHKKLTRTKPSE